MAALVRAFIDLEYRLSTGEGLKETPCRLVKSAIGGRNSYVREIVPGFDRLPEWRQNRILADKYRKEAKP